MSSGYSSYLLLSFLRRSAVAMTANPVLGGTQPEAKVPDRLAKKVAVWKVKPMVCAHPGVHKEAAIATSRIHWRREAG
jgi:hypothetical protein